MIARILKAALIAWVGKKLLTGGSSRSDSSDPTPKAVRRHPARSAAKKSQPARRRAA